MCCVLYDIICRWIEDKMRLSIQYNRCGFHANIKRMPNIQSLLDKIQQNADYKFRLHIMCIAYTTLLHDHIIVNIHGWQKAIQIDTDY